MRLEIRSEGQEPGPPPGAIERKLRLTLGRFHSRVRRVSVHLTDLDGHGGALRARCHIAVRLAPAGRVCVTITEVDLATALDRAAARIGSAVGRKLLEGPIQDGLGRA